MAWGALLCTCSWDLPVIICLGMAIMSNPYVSPTGSPPHGFPMPHFINGGGGAEGSYSPPTGVSPKDRSSPINGYTQVHIHAMYTCIATLYVHSVMLKLEYCDNDFRFTSTHNLFDLVFSIRVIFYLYTNIQYRHRTYIFMWTSCMDKKILYMSKKISFLYVYGSLL